MKRPLIITVAVFICLASAVRLIQAYTLSAPSQQLDINATVGNPDQIVLYTPTLITADSLSLSWSLSGDVNFTSYKIYYSTSPSVDSSDSLLMEITDQNLLTAQAVGLLPATAYYFRVIVTNSLSLTSSSNEVSATTSDQSGNAFVQPPLPAPTIIAGLDADQCPVFATPALTFGTKDPQISTIFINENSDDVSFPTLTSWSKWLAYLLGMNEFVVYGLTPQGLRSATAIYQIPRYQIGDANGDTYINDLDLAGVAWNWGKTWCSGDFNRDNIINDYDLSGLGSHWGSRIFN